MNCTVKSNMPDCIYNDINAFTKKSMNTPQFKNKTFFVSDGCGLIGFYIVCSLLDSNDEFKNGVNVIMLAKNREQTEELYGNLLLRKDFDVVYGDISTFEESRRADYIICFTASEQETDPYKAIEYDVMGTTNVLDYAHCTKSDNVLLVSTHDIYGEVFSGVNRISESDNGYLDVTNQKSCAAQGARAAETLAVCYAEKYDMNIKIARPCCTYGGVKLNDERVWARFFINVVKDQNIILYNNGGKKHSFCYVTDMASALITILLNGESKCIYNAADENSCVTERTFAQITAKAFPNQNLSVIFAHSEDEQFPDFSPSSPSPDVLNTDKLKALGFKAEVSLEDGIRRSVQTTELRSNLRRIR